MSVQWLFLDKSCSNIWIKSESEIGCGSQILKKKKIKRTLLIQKRDVFVANWFDNNYNCHRSAFARMMQLKLASDWERDAQQTHIPMCPAVNCDNKMHRNYLRCIDVDSGYHNFILVLICFVEWRHICQWQTE